MKKHLGKRFYDYLRNRYLRNGIDQWVHRNDLESFAYNAGYTKNQIYNGFKYLRKKVQIGYSGGEYIYYNLHTDMIKGLQNDLKWFKEL